MSKQPVYLDYASTTPVDPRVLEAMLPYFGAPSSSLSPITHNLSPGLWGNPGSLHSFGQEASAAIFKARQTIAAELGCHYSEVIFTGSATDANNLALRGAVKRWRVEGARNKENSVPHTPLSMHPRIIISAIEHESVLNTVKDLAQDGADVVVIPVSKQGSIDLKKLKAALNENTALVSVMMANNETGVVQPIEEIASIIKNFRASLPSTMHRAPYPLFHVDAVQAFQYMKCDVDALGVDLMTLSSQKIYGPKGVGALYARSTMRGVKRIYPIDAAITGGGQEAGLRSGTENVPAIVGFAKAVELVAAVREKEIKRVTALRDELWKGIKKIFPKAVLNGSALPITHNLSPKTYSWLPNNLNIYIPDVSGEQMLVALDLQGIAISSGSACAARSIDPSHVLLAMGYEKSRAKNSLRITLGRPTTKREVDELLLALKKIKQTL